MRSYLVALAVLAACKGPESTPPAASASAAPLPSTPPAASSASARPLASGSGSFPNRTSFSFDSDAAGSSPAGLTSARTGGGREGKWMVVAEPGAPSGANVVAQTDPDPTDSRFPILFANEPTFADVTVSVKCKPVSGKVDQACGLVARYKDANNYYLTRANALEGNVRLYVVEDGKRRQLASWSGKVTSGEWHALTLVAHGDLLVVMWDRVKILDEHDKTFTSAGKVGLWTKADSVTYFDELTAHDGANL